MQFWPREAACCCEDEPCGTIKVTVLKCTDNTAISGANVTVTDSASAVVGSGTTNGSGIYEVAIDAAGTYTIAVVASGHADASVPVTATCTTNNVTVKMGGKITFRVHGCGCALPGATCTMTQTVGGTYTASAITDSSGIAVLYLPSLSGATFQASISAPLYVTHNQTIGPLGSTSCDLSIGTVSFGPQVLATQSGYFCYGGEPPYCRDSIPGTLSFTIPAGVHAGTHTLTYVGQSTGGYTWDICLAGGSSGAGSTRYVFYASGAYFGGASGLGCTTPGGKIEIHRYSSPGCIGTLLSATPSNMTSGTSACPVAATIVTGGDTYTVSE